MSDIEKLVARCNEMDMTEQDQWLGDVFMPQQAQKDLARLQAIEAAAIELFRKPAPGVYSHSDAVERNRLDNLRAALGRKP
jgi:hypothetical protein